MDLNLLILLQFLVLGAILLVVLGVTFIFVTTIREPDMQRYESEKYFTDPSTKEKLPFPSLADEASLDLSVIVPSYNEELRLPVMLDEAIEFLESRQKQNKSLTYEIIVVDDGSKDATTKVALEYSMKHSTERIRVLTLAKNRGKGGAVRLGMLSARGSKCLFADADGASKFADLQKLEKSLLGIEPKKDNMAVVCGSRAHMQDDSVAQRSVFRTILMYGFHFVVWFLCVRGVKDTQCGFKLMTRETALRLFTNLHVNRWAFDVELLYVAQALKIPIAEVAINWQEIDGSKMVPVLSWIQMGKDIILIRLRYILGIWHINDKVKLQ
ncbi:dolichyl-phosphate beta-glucosyltransferase-like [Asterias rubens]|uniref:dolichyl-phosphate beta-glucosyltransferase-like n=1 Tax=Asterias rubens TaxID=7604 RepID=UPI0014557C34|nr:dolichyl-phosphate beta-glucosyltransferase-like [Asterias rubens]